MRIRRIQDDDIAATAQLFYCAVRQGAAGYYDDAQRQAWAPEVPELVRWHDRLMAQTGFVAELDGAIIGFMTMTAVGHIDLAYVAPAYIGKGVAKALYDEIVCEATSNGLSRLTSDASHLARAFFERQGWVVIRPQTVVRDGVSIRNFVMHKEL
ncbi:GNAT family N-acetyltransferase [Thalassospiraceae bacterium LMO-JJ14]|nr:GNAT family N-acetyltransferase [Thalassospiraceae bacterium LMO-JJ14]